MTREKVGHPAHTPLQPLVTQLQLRHKAPQTQWCPGACGHLGHTGELCHPGQPQLRQLGTRSALLCVSLVLQRAGWPFSP